MEARRILNILTIATNVLLLGSVNTYYNLMALEMHKDEQCGTGTLRYFFIRNNASLYFRKLSHLLDKSV